RRRAGGRREAERARLLRHADVERDVGGARERRIRGTRERDQRDREAARDGEQAEDLLALAAVRDGDQHVAADERPDVAVVAFGGVEEEGRGPRRREGRGDLPADDPRLADAGHDDLAAGREQQVEGFHEAVAEPVPEGVDRARLDVEHAPSAGESFDAHGERLARARGPAPPPGRRQGAGRTPPRAPYGGRLSPPRGGLPVAGSSRPASFSHAMNIHEHHGKEILRRYGVPVPEGAACFTVEEAVAAAERLGYPCVVKAQIHAGGRGKAGGVKV